MILHSYINISLLIILLLNIVSGFLTDIEEIPYSEDVRPFLPKYPSELLNLSIVYNPPAINFTSCCKIYNYKLSTLNLNLLGDHIVNSADVRTDSIPTVSWVKQPGKLYTLVALDPDNGPPVGTESFPFMHYQVLNIRDRVEDGDLIISYNGPVPPFGQTHTLYFLLYKQNGVISPTNTGIYAGRNCGPGGPRCMYDIGGFVKDNNLQMVGVKRMKIQTDPYVRHFWITQFGAKEEDQCKNVPGYSKPCKAEREQPFLPSTDGLATSLEITYEAPAISFTSCCRSYNYPFTTTSLSMLGDQYVNTVDVRTGLKPPKITWGNGHDSEYSGLYSILMVDPVNAPHISSASKPFLHYQVLNIKNGQNGNETMGYLGPTPPFGKTHIIYFLLYQQDGTINTSRVATYAGQHCGPNAGRCLYDIDRFVSDNNLTLLAVRRMKVRTDPFSRYVWTTIYGAPTDQHCHDVPGYSVPCKAVQNRPFLPSNNTGMVVDLNIEITTSKNLSIVSCCTPYFYPPGTVKLNEVGNKIVNSALVRSGSSISVIFGQGHVDDKLYTLMLLDTDNSDPVGTESKPFVHYQVFNIRKNLLATGDEVLSYIGPAPPGGQTHELYFVLYEQIGSIIPSSAKTYAGDNCGPNVGRCLYDINKFVAINKLRLVGLKTMKIQTDPYVRYLWTTSFGADERKQCQTVQGYSDPCPGGDTNHGIISIFG